MIVYLRSVHKPEPIEPSRLDECDTLNYQPPAALRLMVQCFYCRRIAAELRHSALFLAARAVAATWLSDVRAECCLTEEHRPTVLLLLGSLYQSGRQVP